MTLFEAQRELGGLLRSGIPPYRLPRKVLEGEIRRILDFGVEARTGAAFTTEAQFAGLSRDYDAVYLALGAGVPKRWPQLDYASAWVMDGATYLAQANSGKPPALGEHLAVIGGGSAAMDVNGYMVDIRSMPREVQVIAFQKGLIPYIPAARDDKSDAEEQ